MSKNMSFSKEYIQEIEEYLSMGFNVYIHSETGRVIGVPEDLEFLDLSIPEHEEIMDILENSIGEYDRLESWSASEAFEMMETFTEEYVSNSFLQKRLFDALSRKKPFRGFKAIIEGEDIYREMWFAYRDAWRLDYVERALNRMQREKDGTIENEEE
jgi:hypothetical protein